MITLLKNFPWIATGTSTWTSPWVHYPAELGDCEFWVVGETHNTGTATVQLQTSVDGASAVDAGTATAVASAIPDGTPVDVQGTMVCVQISSTGDALMTLSVYLVPKQS